MRKATFAALVGASALVVGVDFAAAQVQVGAQLFATQSDFGGSQYAPGGSQAVLANGGHPPVHGPGSVPMGQIQQTNWEGIGYYASSGTDEGLVGPSDSAGDPLVYANTSLGGVNITTNGLANFDNFNPPTTTANTPDANLGTAYSGLSSPTGSLVITEFTGGYTTDSTGEMIVDTPGTATESPGRVLPLSAQAVLPPH